MSGMSFFFLRRTMGRRGETRSARSAAATDGEAADDGEVAGHQGERLRPAVLGPAEAGDGGLVEWIADEMEAAEALDGQDLPGPDERRGLGDDVAAELAPRAGVEEGQARPADRAGDGLGVVAAVERVLVLAPAIGAHGEAGHGRLGAVVGEAADDRIAGAAVGAVGEGVAVAALAGRVDLPEAVGARGDVGRDEDEAGAGAGGADLEAPAALEGRRDARPASR